MKYLYSNCSNYLLARVVLIDALFQGNLTKYKRLVRIEFLKTFSSKDLDKSFNIKQFFNTYEVSNQRSRTNLYLYDQHFSTISTD
jgi:hypothetical protein